MTPSLPKPRVWGRSSPHQRTMVSSKTPQHGYSFSPQTDGPFPPRDRQAWAQKESPARFLSYRSHMVLLQETSGDSGKMRQRFKEPLLELKDWEGQMTLKAKQNSEPLRVFKPQRGQSRNKAAPQSTCTITPNRTTSGHCCHTESLG